MWLKAGGEGESVIEQLENATEAKIKPMAGCYARKETEVEQGGAYTIAYFAVQAEGAHTEQVEVEAFYRDEARESRGTRATRSMGLS